MIDYRAKHISELQGELGTYMNNIALALTGRFAYKGDMTNINTYLRSLPNKTFDWLGNQVVMKLGISTLIVITTDWHAHIGYDAVTGKPRVRIIGTEVEPAIEVLQDAVPETEFGDAMADAVATEYERLQAPYSRTPIPGKKKARTRVAPDQTEVGDHQGTPVFGKPETGKKRKGPKK